MDKDPSFGLDETVEIPSDGILTPSLTAPTRPGSRPKIALVQGHGPHLCDETQELLRGRLRVASLILFFGFAVFLMWRLFVADYSKPEALFYLYFQASVTVVLGFCGGALCRSCSMTMRTLRIKEIIIFGLPALFFIVMHHARMKAGLELHVLENPAPAWMLLIFVYSMLIPNTWRRALVVISAMALAPVLLTLYLWFSNPHCAECLAKDKSFLIELTLLMSVSVVGGTFGVKTIGSLRHEAFKAKQLGQYQLGKKIGSGGMGEVYLAEHQMMKRPCAIKLIRPQQAGDTKVIARFEREVRASAKLTHWNSIEIYDYGRSDDGTFYYVMEYLPGLSLDQLVHRFGPLPAERVVYLLTQTCAALDEAHHLGIVHRDIKPANIFAAERGGVYDVAKLLDFGLAKPMIEVESADLTQEGAIFGSPQFMSPEQATGETDLDARSDIYSLGATAYFLLTGQPPFNDPRPIQVIIAHAREEVTPPTEHRTDIPADIEQVVMRCLAKGRDDRYQSAAELAEALADCEAAGRWTAADAERWWQENASGDVRQVESVVAV